MDPFKSKAMLLTINGHQKEMDEVSTVSDLLGKLDLDPRMVVVELNEKIVRRDALSETPLAEEDSVEILRFVGGG